MTVYHKSATPSDTRATAYDYVVHPPIGRLLNAIADNCAVGGTIQPGVRGAAGDLGYSSAGTITSMLRQLAREGWILYDGPSGCITLLRDPREVISAADREVISPTDQGDDVVISPTDQISATDHYLPESAPISPTDRTPDCTPESAPISPTDRAEWRPDATRILISPTDRSAPRRMVDHVLAAAESESRSAAAKYNLPCGARTITASDRVIWRPDAVPESSAVQNSQKSPDSAAVAAALAALQADERILAEILAVCPDLEVAELADQWRLALDCERDGKTPNARRLLFGVLRKGERLRGRATDGAPIDPGQYAGNSLFRLGSDTSDLDDDPDQDLRRRANTLLPAQASGRDYVFVLGQLAAGATDDQALDALALRSPPRTAGRAGGVR